VTEVKLGKDVPFYYFSLGTIDLWTILTLLLTSHRLTVGEFAAPAPQFANQILGGFSHVFRHYIPGTHVVACRDIGQKFATGTQRLAAQCFGPAPKGWADPTEEAAEKISDPVSSLKVERGGVDGTYPRGGGKSTSCLI